MPTETAERVRVADVVLDARSGGSDAKWTYKVEGDAAEGDAYFVPLGPRSVIGFVVRVYEATEEELGFTFKQLRGVQEKIEGLSLPPSLVEVVKFVASEYLCPLSVALSVASPPGIRERLVTAWTLLTEDPGETPLTPLQEEVLKVLKEGGGRLLETKGKKLQASSAKALKLLRAKGIVGQRMGLQPLSEKRKSAGLLRLTSDEEKVEAFLKKEGKKRPAQALTLMRLQTAEQAALTPTEIKALSGVTDTTVKALVDAGLLEKVDEAAAAGKVAPKPNPFQQLAIDAIVDAVHEKRYEPFLLYGITGSGKTEVYLRAASETLRQGRQVLYLVPEIALAAQAIAQLRDRFGRNVAILHSELPPGERLENWMQIREGDAPVVLGARSALFAPLDNIGLIILDEEHESSYKQESSPRYHAKRVATELAKLHGAALVLGSATPSIESFYEAEEGRLNLLSLPERAASANLPSVHIEDLTLGYKEGKPSMLSEELYTRIERNIEKGEQTILFLNRRAYSPFLICRDCGHQFMCPRCAVSLAYSRRDKKLRCHHCGYKESPPDICPSCRSLKLNPFGVGTEKVEEAVAFSFPAAKVARLDRDVARKKGALEEILAQFRSGDLDILVGTQMVAKGLDFPNVTLVGVIAADISLNIPDFRSSERTFQLLSQVAGRAGRGRLPGHVVIQTFNPQHIAVTAAQNHDFIGFYEAMKHERRETSYPPFSRMVNIILSGEQLAQVTRASEEIASLLRSVSGTLLGPADCAIERLQNRWRRHLLIKLPPGSNAEEIGEKLKDFDPAGVQVVIDVDPYSLS